MSGCTPKRSVAPPAAIARPVLTSSKMSTMPWRRVSSRTCLEVALLGEHDAEVHHRRLHDHAGGLAAFGVSRSIRRSIAPASLNGTAIVSSTTASGMPAPYGREA